MNALFQLQCACSISHKVIHPVQLFHSASLKSSRVMKDKAWGALKNELIFNIMIPSLNIVSTVYVIGQTSNSPQVTPAQL